MPKIHTSALASAIIAVGVLGCASTQVKTDEDPRANLWAYRTFDVKPGQVLDNGVVDKHDTLVQDRVEAALHQELQDKGLKPTDQAPELIATYTAGARTYLVPDDWDGGWYGGWDDNWVDEYTEGKLVIDLIDTKTNKTVWRSVVKTDEDDLRSAKHIGEAVEKAFEKYPGT